MSRPLTYSRTERLTISTSAAASSTITSDRPITLAVVGNVAFHVLIAPSADSPEAATTDAYFPANEVYLFPLPAGSEISIRAATNGFAWVSEVY